MKKQQPTSVVTGAAGFLGSHLADLLLARRHKVIGIDNFVTGSVDNISHLAGNPDFKFIQVNLVPVQRKNLLLGKCALDLDGEIRLLNLASGGALV